MSRLHIANRHSYNSSKSKFKIRLSTIWWYNDKYNGKTIEEIITLDRVFATGIVNQYKNITTQEVLDKLARSINHP